MLNPNSHINVELHSSSNRLEVFCYLGESKAIQSLFKTVEVMLLTNCFLIERKYLCFPLKVYIYIYIVQVHMCK